MTRRGMVINCSDIPDGVQTVAIEYTGARLAFGDEVVIISGDTRPLVQRLEIGKAVYYKDSGTQRDYLGRFGIWYMFGDPDRRIPVPFTADMIDVIFTDGAPAPDAGPAPGPDERYSPTNAGMAQAKARRC